MDVRCFVVLGVVGLAACGGAIESSGTGSPAPAPTSGQDDGRPPTTSTPPSSATRPPSKPPGPASAGEIPAGKPLPTTGVCAERKTSPGKIGGAVPGVSCTVANATKEAGTGFVSIANVEGDRGDAALSSDTLILRCATAKTMLFQAAIRCFEGAGDYTVAPGDLILGGDSSDRACRIAIDLDAKEVRGFLDCPNAPEDPDNVFASSGPPIGLGHFDLPRTF